MAEALSSSPPAFDSEATPWPTSIIENIEQVPPQLAEEHPTVDTDGESTGTLRPNLRVATALPEAAATSKPNQRDLETWRHRLLREQMDAYLLQRSTLERCHAIDFFTLTVPQRQVLKCSIAYLIASLFTFVPVFANLLSTSAQKDVHGRLIRKPAYSAHMVATIVCYVSSCLRTLHPSLD